MKSGIYLFEHIATGRCYVGQSKNMTRRRVGHIESARNGSDTHFHRALRLYGIEAFAFSILEECTDEMSAREMYWIERTAAYWLGFNMTPGGETSPLLVPEIASRVSEKMKGKKKTAEHIAKTASTLRGRKQTQEAIRARSTALTGRRLTPEHVAKISAANKGKSRGLGRKDTPELIAAKRLRTLSSEHKQLISTANSGRKFSEESRLKMSLAKLGTRASLETRQKMSASHKMRCSLEATGL